MRTIKTTSGKTFEIRFCGVLQLYNTKGLYIEFIGETLVDMVNRFSNPDESGVLYSYVDGEPHKTFIGFTNLTEAGLSNGNTYIRLETPVPEVEEQADVEELQG